MSQIGSFETRTTVVLGKNNVNSVAESIRGNSSCGFNLISRGTRNILKYAIAPITEDKTELVYECLQRKGFRKLLKLLRQRLLEPVEPI
jgi:hypothetical protein